MPETKRESKRQRRKSDMRAIAKVSMGQILGLVEAVDEVSGSADAATIAQEVEMDVAALGPIIGAAEFLGLVEVRDGDLVNTDLADRLLEATTPERKAIIRDIIDDVPVFRQVTDMARAAGRALSREEIVETLTASVGSHQAGDIFDALVYWGRYVRMVIYDSQSELFVIQPPPT